VVQENPENLDLSEILEIMDRVKVGTVETLLLMLIPATVAAAVVVVQDLLTNQEIKMVMMVIMAIVVKGVIIHRYLAVIVATEVAGVRTLKITQTGEKMEALVGVVITVTMLV
tara:strand:+ start:63 stop:401 length:339 start_codon:yes stop_codon:yes gene_type:complete